MASAPLDFQTLFEYAPQPQLVFDRALRVVAANAAYRRLASTGLELPEAYTVAELFDDPAGPSVALVRESLERVLSAGHPDKIAALPRFQGAALDAPSWSATHTPVLDAQGEVAVVLQSLTDAAASSEARLRESQELAQERQRLLAEAIPVQVWTAGPDGALTFVNQRVVDYFQAPRELILGAGWQAVLHPDELPECLARWNHSLRTGEPYEVEFRLRRGDGEYRWHLGRALALRDDTGAVLCWFGSNTDVDEARRAIAELRLRSEYEQRLLGIVSHDLRGPLQTVAVASALLLDGGNLPDKERKTVSRVVSAAGRAGRLIDDLLGFALARRGSSIPINPRPTNLREIIEQVVDEVHVLERARTVRVEHQGDECGAWDADRIAQVVANLVGNAFQHSPSGAVVTVHSQLAGEHAMLRVCNEGPPIESDDLLHLFEPFKRGNNARSTQGRSVGLGLYIARELVLAHGGTIEVSSSQDAGTCFTVRMPRYVAASA